MTPNSARSALDRAFSGTRPFDAAMSEYQRTRDARVKAMYEFTCQLATLEPLPPEMQQLFRAVHGNPKAMDEFARMNAGTISPAEFFAPRTSMRLRPPPRTRSLPGEMQAAEVAMGGAGRAFGVRRIRGLQWTWRPAAGP